MRHLIGTQLSNSEETLMHILMTDEVRDHIKGLGRPIALDYLAAVG